MQSFPLLLTVRLMIYGREVMRPGLCYLRPSSTRPIEMVHVRPEYAWRLITEVSKVHISETAMLSMFVCCSVGSYLTKS